MGVGQDLQIALRGRKGDATSCEASLLGCLDLLHQATHRSDDRQPLYSHNFTVPRPTALEIPRSRLLQITISSGQWDYMVPAPHECCEVFK